MKREISWAFSLSAVMCTFFSASPGTAAVLTYGDLDRLGSGPYANNPTSGATLSGLAPGVSTLGFYGLGGEFHGFPFSPGAGDHPGTDQIYVGSVQTGSHDGYSVFAGRLPGPQLIAMDYSSIVPAGETIQTLTLGIGFDDFQQPLFGQPYIVKVNGVTDTVLTTLANSFDQTGPRSGFASIGIDTSILNGSHILTLSIDQGGNGGDGWAVNFLTIGITSSAQAVPEPASLTLAGLGAIGLVAGHRRRKQKTTV